MTLRRTVVTVALAGCLAGVPLAGCDSNAGVAAQVGNQQISESDVASYVTPQATPFTADNGQYVQPKVAVVTQLIQEQLAQQLLATTPGGQPGPSALQQAEQAVLTQANATRDTLVNTVTKEGFTPALVDVAIRTEALFAILGNRTGNLDQFLSQHRIPVSVDPRYGTWNASSLNVSGGVQPNLPFLKLQSSYTPVAPSQ